MSWIRNFAVIIGIFIAPLLILDAYFLYDKLDYRVNRTMCDRALTNYDYCPSVTDLRYMNLTDKWLPVVNFIDQNRRSSYGHQKVPEITKRGRIYLIGDSFIQAEEIEISNRFEHYLRQQGYEVIAMGYSSWNSVQYHSIVKTLELNKNDHVFIFSFGNDFTPSYSRSSIKTILGGRQDKVLAKDDRILLRKIYENSLIRNTYSRAKNQFTSVFNSQKKDSKKIKISHDVNNFNDCNSIPAIEAVASNLVSDYIYLSKSSACWTDKIKRSVDYNVNLLKESKKIVESQDAAYTTVLVPAGWALKNENTSGRAHPQYQIPSDITISQVGLSRYLEESKLNVFDLEILLKKYYTRKSDELYWPADGHWNEKAHKIIGKHLEQFLLSKR